MPRLGMAMEEGAVVAWPRAVGERVQQGDVVVVIEHDKAEAEIEAHGSGYLRHIYVEPDPEAPVPCGTLLAVLTETADEPFDAAAFRAAEPKEESDAGSAASRDAPRASGRTEATLRATRQRGAAPVAPAARGLAKKLGIDVAQVPGSGPGGRVLKQDVEAWSARRPGLVEAAPGVWLDAPVEGQGDPVLLLPGFGSDISVYALQTQVLRASFQVRAVNPRGVGASSAPADACYEVGVQASDAAALIEGPTHVVGASLGAAVAIELAIAHPEKVRSLSLITPFLRASPRLLAVVEAWCQVAAIGNAGALARVLLPWLFSSEYLADDARRARMLRGLTQMAARVPPATLDRVAAGLRAWSGTRELEPGALPVPTLVLCAGGDLLAPESKSIAGARVVTAPASGHALTLEAPDLVNEALASHFRSAGP